MYTAVVGALRRVPHGRRQSFPAIPHTMDLVRITICLVFVLYVSAYPVVDTILPEEDTMLSDAADTNTKVTEHPGFKIKARGKCLTTPASVSTTNGANPILQDCAKANQKWTYNKNKQHLKSRGKCLDTSNDFSKNGALPHMWDCQNNNQNQMWALNEDSTEPQLLKATKRHKCLDTTNSRKNGVKPHLWNCDGTNMNQLWEIVRPSETNAASGANTHITHIRTWKHAYN